MSGHAPWKDSKHKDRVEHSFPPEEVEALRDFREVFRKRNDLFLEEIHWFDMSVGFFIAKGLSVERAHTLAIALRYDLHYFSGTKVTLPGDPN